MQAIFIFCLFWLREVSAQNVTVEPLSPQPACLNELLVYNCQVEFSSLSITWRHNVFGSLRFIAGDDEEGSMTTSSDGRVVANLTMNEGTMSLRMVASTLTIQPPLIDLNNTNLNDTTLTCEGIDSSTTVRSGTATIMLAGEPLPPDNLHNATSNDMPTATIMWDHPGTGPSIQTYTIRIPEINYSEEEDGTAHSHVITADGTGVMFNTHYEVQVTAINACGGESNPAVINVNIEAREPSLLTSLRATLHCSDWNILRVDIQWEYGSSSVYTPPIETVTMDVNGPAPISANGCSHLTQSNMNCSFNIVKGGLYVVRLTTTNEVGTVSSDNTFDFAPLSVNYSGLTSDESPGITATLNSLCSEPVNNFFVGVLFGIQRIGGMDCRFMQSETVLFSDSRIVFVPLNTDVVMISTDQTADYEYCAKVILSDGIFDVCRSEAESKECFSAGAASGITLVLTLLLVLPLGILIGCCTRGSLYRRQATESNSGKPRQSVGAIYEEPEPVEAAIPLSENLAYGHVQGQRRN